MGKEANTLLIEGIKDGKPDLKILPPLYVYDENNEYTAEVRNCYMEKKDKHYFYVLECADSSFYAGYTNNLERRVRHIMRAKGQNIQEQGDPYNAFIMKSLKQNRKQ